jgi:hypothetical protein
MKYQTPLLQPAGVASRLIQSKTIHVMDDSTAFRPPTAISALLESD